MSDVPQTAADAQPEVVAPDGVQPRSEALVETEGDSGEAVEIESPAKIIRIGSMVKQLLEEVRNTDRSTRPPGTSCGGSTTNSVTELKAGAVARPGRGARPLSFDFSGTAAPSEAELRMAQAQLVGWLEGLFHGIQATLFAQQMAARQQLEGMRGPVPQIGPQPNAGPGYL